MPLESPPVSNDVTVLVFKDNHASKSFKIPLQWISRLGALLGLLAFGSLVCAYLAAKYYRTSRATSVTHVRELEQELVDLRGKVNATAPVPIPTVTVTAAPLAQVPALPSSASSSSSVTTPLFFSAMPAKVQAPPKDLATVPIALVTPKITWEGKTLSVNFALQYIRDDKGSQQGRIILLARGPETLLAYPDGALNRPTADSLVAPDQGEYFSVSRFREVHAEFGPLKSADAIQDIEAIILSQAGQVLIHQVLSPTASAKALVKPPIKPAKTSLPKKKDSDLIEPGYDQ